MNLITSMYIFIFFLLIVQTGSENPHTRSPSGQNTSRQGEGNSTTDASIIVSTHNAPDDGSTTTHPPNAVATSNVIQNSTANQPLSAVSTSAAGLGSTATSSNSSSANTAEGLSSTTISNKNSSVNTSASLGSTVISYSNSSASPTSTVSTTAAGLGSTATSSNSYSVNNSETNSASPTSTVNTSASLGSTVISYTNSSVPSLTCFNVTSNNQGKSLEYHALSNICKLIQSCLTGNVLFYVILPTSEDGTGKAKSSSSISNSLVIIVKVNETCPVSLPANFMNPPINIGKCLDSNYSLRFEDYPLKDVKNVTCNHNGSTNNSTDVTTTAPAATDK
ncbi:putative protein TPRXL [Protopterus annectens]|uniref:putative protein TPRXL n=1 Tax=Protopterus annectens TaxID=7888 RepID=UPI001CFAEA67|nr:putative protein TPRXL [Protopterus annectens]